jgi:hydroxymethylpyrimidine/phosphomethylpyrimidine kinase
MKPAFFVLTVAGSDSGGGAGIQADSRAIGALGGFAATAITAVTAQNTRGIAVWEPVTPRLIREQIASVLADLPVRTMKTGLLASAAAVHAVADSLADHPDIPLVVDPVFGSTSGTIFLDRAGIAALKRRLLPRATLVTPNWPEAAALSGQPVTSYATALAAGQRIMDEAGCDVLVKGGHAAGWRSCDLLVTAAGTEVFEGSRIATRNTHGTGCVLSAAIAAGLAQELSIELAIKQARRLLRAGLRRGRKDDWGGRGPALGV